MNRQVRNIGKKALVELHRSALRLGLVLLPNHYYSPVADVHDLERSRPSWARRSAMTGIEVDLEKQATRLREMVLPFLAEYRDNAAYERGQRDGFGPGFGWVEAQCLHGVLRSLKPRRIIEIGCGVSTHCALEATAVNAAEGRPAEITCIEPYPSDYLKSIADIRLVVSKVEDVDPAFFDQLESGDFLFIDSSHAVRPVGHVVHLYLEVLPRIKPGCVVHIHDIYFPYVYQRNLLHDVYQQAETALLQAYLTNNPRVEILFSLGMLHYDEQALLQAVFPGYRPQPDQDGLSEPGAHGHFPSSIYLRTM